MAMNASAYEMAALAKMPYKTLTKVSEDPNYVELSKLRREVYQNCAAVHSFCNGNNGHLGIAMPINKYTTKMEELRILQHHTTRGHMTAALHPMLDKFNKVGVRWSTRNLLTTT